ncbi:MAG: serine/threonine-protein kinase, partial [Planctomycetota bacterium]
MNNQERDALLDEIFAAARDLSTEDQERMITERCLDATLQRDLRDLLEAHRQAPKGDFANRLLPQGAVARKLIDDSVETALPDEVKVGARVGVYKLLQKIGEGGMGTVYMAEQTSPITRRVAVKIIKPDMVTDQTLARFEAERQALAMMDHPSIARVLDAGATASGAPYFVMELVKGVPITDYCDEQRLTTADRLRLFVTVCNAVAHAHVKGVIHRDLKPSNVLVVEYDHRAEPKVIDFGVAKATSQKLTERTLFTQFGQIVGTLEYMSPEQAKLNQLDIDVRSDVYSLGVLLYEMLAGVTPFDKQRLRSGALDEILRIIREEEPPKPSTRLSSSGTLPRAAANRWAAPHQLARSIRGDLDWIVMKALAKERSDRYQSAGEFSRDIERHLNDQPIEARRPSALGRTRRFARRNRLPVTLGALAMFAVLTASGFAARAVIVERHGQALSKQVLETEKERRMARQAEKKASLRSFMGDLAGHSRNLRDFRQTLGILLADELLTVSRRNERQFIALAHEALLNSVPTLSGRPLVTGKSYVESVALTERWLVAHIQPDQVVRLYHLEREDFLRSPVELTGRNSGIQKMIVDDEGRRLVAIGDRIRIWDLTGPDRR